MGESMDPAGGRVGLFSSPNTGVACGAEAGLIDKLAYGSGACPEGTGIGALSVSNAAVRNNAGNMDTDNNSHDFTILALPTPRNSSSPTSPYCVSTPARTPTWGALKSIYR
jgi:hypothetical protein